MKNLNGNSKKHLRSFDMLRIFVIPLDKKDHPAKNVRLMPLIDQLKNNMEVEIYGVERTPYFNTSNTLLKFYNYIKYFINISIYGIKNRKDIDIILGESIYFGMIGAILSCLIMKPMILDTHDGNFTEHCKLLTNSRLMYKLIIFLENIVSSMAKIIVVLSEKDKQFYREQGFKYLNKIRVIPSGINLNIVDNEKDDKIILRKRLGLNPKGLFLFFAGNMNYPPNKEAALWINNTLAPELDKKLGAIKIIITGIGNISENMHPNVSYLGYVTEYYQYIFASDIGLVPYEMHTGISTKLIDFLACGLPTICMKSVADLFPQLTNNINVFVADTRREFIEKTLLAIDEKDFRVSVGDNGRKVIEKYYCMGHIINLWKNVFKECYNEVL